MTYTAKALTHKHPVSDPEFVAETRRRDLLLTAVMVCIGLTPAWLLPPSLALPWQLLTVALGLPALYVSWNYAPWVPTPAHDMALIVEALQLDEAKSFCDLGAGDARVVIAMAQQTEADCYGIELAPLQYALGRIRLLIQGNARTHLLFGDLHQAPLSKYDAVYVWGTAYWVGTPAFSATMQAQLKVGARLVSYHQALVDLEPTAVDSRGQRPIYIYVMGE